MRQVEHLQGKGIVTTDQGKVISVEYDIQITKEGVDGGHERASNQGLKNTSGVVDSSQDSSFILVYFGQSMTLQMEGGRRLRFFHKDIDGNIVLNHWLD